MASDISLGEIISLARGLKGWTLRDLEKQSGISNALISQIETGHVSNPGFFTVIKIIQALGLPLERAAMVRRAPKENVDV
jgi:transcriptional regulator with XRE-family HTH domain